MMAGKNKRAYLNDFVPDVNGEYVYNGKLFHWQEPEKRRPALTRLWLEAGIAALGSLICGILPGKGLNNTFYIILPYIIELCSAALLIWALWKITRAGAEIREYIYKSSVLKLPARNYFVGINAVLLVIGQIVFIVKSDSLSNSWVEWLIIAIQIVVGGMSYLIHRQFDEIKWSDA